MLAWNKLRGHGGCCFSEFLSSALHPASTPLSESLQVCATPRAVCPLACVSWPPPCLLCLTPCHSSRGAHWLLAEQAFIFSWATSHSPRMVTQGGQGLRLFTDLMLRTAWSPWWAPRYWLVEGGEGGSVPVLFSVQKRSPWPASLTTELGPRAVLVMVTNSDIVISKSSYILVLATLTEMSGKYLQVTAQGLVEERAK